MTPEEKARVKIDKQLNNAGWDIVSRDEYIPMSTTAVKEVGTLLYWAWQSRHGQFTFNLGP